MVAAALMALGGSASTDRASRDTDKNGIMPIKVERTHESSASPPPPKISRRMLSNESSSLSPPRKCVRGRVQIVWQCVNPACVVSRASELKDTASPFLTSFYGAKVDPKKKRKVCKDCGLAALERRKELETRVQSGLSLLSEEDRLPVPKDMVVLDDSDEEFVTDESDTESLYQVDLGDESEQSNESRLNSLLNSVLKDLNFETQVKNCAQVISNRLDKQENEFKEMDKAFKVLEGEVNAMRNELYAGFKPQIKELPPINADEAQNSRNFTYKYLGGAPVSLPPTGELDRPLLSIGNKAFAMRGNILNVWKEGIVIEVDKRLPLNNGLSCSNASVAEVVYKLRFENVIGGKIRSAQTKILSRRHVAYSSPSSVRLPVGTRVIAIYKDDSFSSTKGEFYSGVIAEPPKVMNRYRYLVFFDDGYASYIRHDDIRSVTHQCSPNVWEDIHPNSREFIKQYLSQYPERPMVKLSVDQIVWTEWDGKWWATKVLSVDASLVKLLFKDTGRTESVYRGSTRLSPLFKEMQQQKMRKEGLISVRRHGSGRRNTPYVEYTRQMDESNQQMTLFKRAVARKSTAQKKNEFDLSAPPKVKWENEGEVYRVTLPEYKVSTRVYAVHECGPSCILSENAYDQKIHLKKYNILLIPIILGWERQLTKHKNLGCRKIFYVAPCGRRLRHLDDVHKYLVLTKSNLEIDFFTFEWWVHVYNEFKPLKELCKITDISYGKENVPISCVNSLDNNYPEYVEYSTERLPQSGVNINLDDNFLVGCDCEDDCRDKTKCNCWKLTVEGTSSNAENKTHPMAGYTHRRLPDVVPTGIYECNSKCKCSKTCWNRVAQNPLRLKLQVFKTEKRGWGIRTLHDIPQGGFVCVYVGNLYNNEEANKLGRNFGDEYFAELDMIEAVERRKDGYESDCGEEGDMDCKENVEVISDFSGSNEDDDELRLSDDDEPEDPSSDRTVVLRHIRPDFPSIDRQTRSIRRKKKLEDDEEITVHENEVSGSAPNEGGKRTMKGFDAPVESTPKPKHTSTRKFFNKDEDVYIMDAKTIGNVGRYLNHSCNPNVFVQNCFVDTHDLRYPWISFFASTYIRAGSELCWDYCYIVDQVEGKEIYCECGAQNCRGRLL